ncbi:MAG: YgiT-type zinc finger protein [Anaerolineae bacterium]|nr:YgiT-type zinc finger protein [Anaerolineae bacterium]
MSGQIVVIDHVPAEVCSVCGDVLLRACLKNRDEGINH